MSQKNQSRISKSSIYAELRASLIVSGQVAFLQALLGSPDGTATVDDATADLGVKFQSGGKWRGSIPRPLSVRGIIKRIGDRMSDRPSRNRSYVSLWRLCDKAQAMRELDRLSRWLDEKENPQSAATDAGEIDNTNSINSNGVKVNASK